jgi:hypothetical protein
VRRDLPPGRRQQQSVILLADARRGPRCDCRDAGTSPFNAGHHRASRVARALTNMRATTGPVRRRFLAQQSSAVKVGRSGSSAGHHRASRKRASSAHLRPQDQVSTLTCSASLALAHNKSSTTANSDQDLRWLREASEPNKAKAAEGVVSDTRWHARAIHLKLAGSTRAEGG